MSDPDAELPPPQRLALTYASKETRPAILALFLLDARLAAVLRTKREPIAAQLRFAWWRETLEKPAAEWPHGEPALDALRGWRDASGLAVLAEGWEALLSDRLFPEVIAEFVAARGHAFACLARELGIKAISDIEDAARAWALADLAANLSSEEERSLVVGQGSGLATPPLPRALRPLAVLAGLGVRALRRGGRPLLDGPGSALLALRIGLSGR